MSAYSNEREIRTFKIVTVEQQCRLVVLLRLGEDAGGGVQRVLSFDAGDGLSRAFVRHQIRDVECFLFRSRLGNSRRQLWSRQPPKRKRKSLI